jgi:hypothetical protein
MISFSAMNSASRLASPSERLPNDVIPIDYVGLFHLFSSKHAFMPRTVACLAKEKKRAVYEYLASRIQHLLST